MRFQKQAKALPGPFVCSIGVQKPRICGFWSVAAGASAGINKRPASLR